MTAWLPKSFRRPAGGFHFTRLHRYLLSYLLLVLLLLAVVSAVVYGTFVRSLQRAAEDAAVMSLGQVQETVETRVREMNRVAQQVAANPLLARYLVSGSGYDQWKAVGELAKYRSSNEFMEDLVLAYDGADTDQLFAASGTYRWDTFFESVYNAPAFELPVFRETVAFMKHPVLRPVEGRQGEKAPIDLSMYLVRPQTGAQDKTVLFLIRASAWKTILSTGLTENEGMQVLVNEYGTPLAIAASGSLSESELASLQKDLPAMTTGKQVQTWKGEAGSYAVVRVTSEFNGWSYLKLMPTSQFLLQVKETQRVFLLGMAVVFLLGLSLAVVLSVRNYRPIRSLAEGLPLKTRDSWPARRDEVTLIGEAIGQVTRENEGLRSELTSQAGVLKEKYVLAFLQGKIRTRAQLDEMLRFSAWRLDKPCFAVLAFAIDEYAGFRARFNEQERERIKGALLREMESRAGETGAGWAAECPDESRLVLLLNLPETYEEESLVSCARGIQQACAGRYGLSLTAGIGGLCSEVGLVPVSYQQAEQAIRYRFVKGAGHVIHHSEVETAASETIWYPVELEAELVKAIKQGDEEEAQRLLRETFEAIVRQPRTIEEIECVSFDLINTVMKMLAELGIGLSGYADRTLERIFVSHCETLEELEQQMADFCRQVCAYAAKQNSGKSGALPDKLLPYVHEHYRDPTLSLKRMADEFGLSPSYLTRYFKDHSGVPLMRYVDLLRVGEAKELLRTTELTVRDIVEAIGETDSTNFIRKFKKAEGVTPIQYRNLTRTTTDIRREGPSQVSGE
ncbi:hypothetical protein J31TS4_08650 [Paenibacillus sp. J31TS4]|uniref:helix-turn-helix domain-containing protein n=1 Tax=Paenibacillus sp. J31TS4 TaxID=2807195 RepID=UPI001B170C16|nr:helix-turn-helix domain-containing protein [Paenibacillus sp. J31TS4]GIP37585.1 hypothetical protein J31TS4_08650 [Paenibacillus sp. J31TS4]